MFSWYKYLIVNLVFFPPRFWEWESFSDCAFSSLPTCTFSHAYKRVGSTTALSTFSLVSSLIPFRFQTFARSLPKATLAFGSALIISVHCAGESASQVGKFINNFQLLSIHSDDWFIVRFSMCWLMYNLLC